MFERRPLWELLPGLVTSLDYIRFRWLLLLFRIIPTPFDRRALYILYLGYR